MPPPRLAVGTQFPKRPGMGANTEKWVDEVRRLVDDVGGVVAGSQQLREAATVARKVQRNEVVVCATATEDEARRRVDKMDREIRAVRKRHGEVAAELLEVLRVRNSAREKLDAVAKPLKDLFRRIDYRKREAPSTEAQCDSVTRDLIQGAESLSAAVRGLEHENSRAEHAAVHLDELATALRRDMEHRERLLAEDAVFVDSSTSALATKRAVGGGGLSSPRLPALQRSTGADLLLSSGGGRAPSQLAGSGAPQAKNTSYMVTDPQRVAELAAAAITTSKSIRAQIKSCAKQVDDQIARNTKLVTESTQRTIDDTSALLKILNERIGLLDNEMAEVDRQRKAAMNELSRMAGPLEDNMAKLHMRKQAKQKSKTIPEAGLVKDPLTDASSREAGRLQIAVQSLRNQLHALDMQHQQLASARQKLVEARASKAKLLAVDRRVLEIGNTPRPPSYMSTASSRLSMASSMASSPRSARGGGKASAHQ